MAGLAVFLRLLCTLAPPNYDVDSWNIVCDLLRRGEPVYTSTPRYNYTPFWMGILWTAKDLPPGLFRLSIAAILATTDLAIGAVLKKLAGPAAAIIFLFNPWSIGISGHQLQFDNIAILIGLLALGYMARCTGSIENGPRPLTVRQTVVVAAIFGASMLAKHLFYMFPLWMALRVEHRAKRAIWLLLPPAIFLVSFLPAWAEQHEGIMANVFGYTSRFNAPFMNSLGPAIFDTLTGCDTHTRVEHAVMHGAVLLAGITLRRRPLELLAIYCAVLVTFASGTYNHYFAIPAIFVALYPNRWGFLYAVLGVPYYLLDRGGFNLGRYLPPSAEPALDSFGSLGHILLICVLGAALLTHLRPGWEQRSISWGWSRFLTILHGRV